MSDRFEDFIFPCFMGLKIADLNHLDFDFHYFEARLRPRLDSLSGFSVAHTVIGIVLYVGLLCFII